jgi:aspartyl-tRNA(Asn)/glutamyl-tRNA(Gln) amidotransferase subunit C
MSVSIDEVKHIAALARLNFDGSRLAALAGELNSILGHIEVLRTADTASVLNDDAAGRGAMLLRSDDLNPVPLQRGREEFAPSMRDGFLIVPRLATHEDGEGEGA